MMGRNKLSALAVGRAKAKGYYGDGDGLYLQVSGSGARSWVYRYRAAGRTREMGLGSLSAVSLALARQKAQECREARALGKDPIEERRAPQAALRTFRECAEGYIETHRAAWRGDVTAQVWRASLAAYAYPSLGSLPVEAIDTPAVLRALAPSWAKYPAVARRVRNRIENVLDWAKALGYRDGDNPARWRGHLDHLLPAVRPQVEHHAAMPYAEIADFLADLQSQDGIPAAAVAFTILTAARVGEVRGARWGEIEGDVWTVPAARMKTGREHRVPLSPPAVAIAERMASIRRDDYVFAGPLGNMAMPRLLARLRPGVTMHGFRSSFRDWAAECTDFPAEVAEMALAHTVSNKVEAAYRRGDLFDKRRGIMDAWANYCGAKYLKLGAPGS